MLTLGLKSHTGTRSTGREADAIRDEEDRSSFVSLLKKEFKVVCKTLQRRKQEKTSTKTQRQTPKKNCSVFKGKTQRSAVGAPPTLTHSPHPLPLAEHIYLRASISAFSLPVIRPRRAPSLGV